MYLPRKIWVGNINTSESEYFPSLTIDGKELVFTRQTKWIQMKIFFTVKKIGNNGQKAKPMEGDVNYRTE